MALFSIDRPYARRHRAIRAFLLEMGRQSIAFRAMMIDCERREQTPEGQAELRRFEAFIRQAKEELGAEMSSAE